MIVIALDIPELSRAQLENLRCRQRLNHLPRLYLRPINQSLARISALCNLHGCNVKVNSSLPITSTTNLETQPRRLGSDCFHVAHRTSYKERRRNIQRMRKPHHTKHICTHHVVKFSHSFQEAQALTVQNKCPLDLVPS